MDCWMNDERLDITRKYVHDMINSFVEDPKGTNYHNEYNPPYMDDKFTRSSTSSCEIMV